MTNTLIDQATLLQAFIDSQHPFIKEIDSATRTAIARISADSRYRKPTKSTASAFPIEWASHIRQLRTAVRKFQSAAAVTNEAASPITPSKQQRAPKSTDSGKYSESVEMRPNNSNITQPTESLELIDVTDTSPRPSDFVYIFQRFMNSQKLCIDEYLDILDHDLGETADANADDPFFVSHLRKQEHDLLEGDSSEKSLLLRFYASRLVEHYLVNEYNGSILENNVQEDFRKAFPRWADQCGGSKDNAIHGSKLLQGLSAGTRQERLLGENSARRALVYEYSESNAIITNSGPALATASAALPESSRLDTLREGTFPAVSSRSACLGDGLRSTALWILTVLILLADRLREGLSILEFWCGVSNNLLGWIWSTPVLFLPRFLVGSIIVCTITVTIALISILYALELSGLLSSSLDTFSLLARSCLSFGTTFFGISISTQGSAVVPFPTPNNSFAQSSTSTTLQDITNGSDTVPSIINDFVNIHNLSLTVYALNEVLTATFEDFKTSSSIAKASQFPRKDELVSGYSELRILIQKLTGGLRIYQTKVYTTLTRVKRKIADVLSDLQKLELNPDMIKIPPALSFSIRCSQWTLHALASICDICSRICPAPRWQCWVSNLMSFLASGLRSFLDREIRCANATVYATPQPTGCWFLLSSASKVSLIELRGKVFREVVGKYAKLLNNFEVGLNIIEGTLAYPQELLGELETQAQLVNDNLQDTQICLDQERTVLMLARDEQLKEWNSRSWLGWVFDFLRGRTLEKEYLNKKARRQVQTRDLTTLRTLHQRASYSLTETQSLIDISRQDIILARDFGDGIMEYFQGKFCFGSVQVSAEQDCGSDQDFLEGIKQMSQELYDLQPLLERIETAGLMAIEVRNSVPERKKEIISICAAEEVVLEKQLDEAGIGDPFKNIFKLRSLRRSCVMREWLKN